MSIAFSHFCAQLVMKCSFFKYSHNVQHLPAFICLPLVAVIFLPIVPRAFLLILLLITVLLPNLMLLFLLN